MSTVRTALVALATLAGVIACDSNYTTGNNGNPQPVR